MAYNKALGHYCRMRRIGANPRGAFVSTLMVYCKTGPEFWIRLGAYFVRMRLRYYSQNYR